jgi:hypothetical protein
MKCKITTVRCAGPGCVEVKKEGNNWLMGTMEFSEGKVLVRVEHLEISRMKDDDYGWCGVGCLSKSVAHFVANRLQDTGHKGEVYSEVPCQKVENLKPSMGADLDD